MRIAVVAVSGIVGVEVGVGSGDAVADVEGDGVRVGVGVAAGVGVGVGAGEVSDGAWELGSVRNGTKFTLPKVKSFL